MKQKNLISIFGNHVSTFALTLFSALMLTACGEEVNIEGPGTSEEGLTVFSQVSDGTRTTMDTDGLFYWQSMNVNNVITNDQIWIDEAGTGASFSLQSASSEFENNNRLGKFYFRKALGANTYNLSYTGFGSTTGDKVTIREEQVQSAWNNSDHIGTSGDCATATASKVQGSNNYSFTLEHKSSYLIFKPYAPAATSTNIYRLTSIEIVDLEDNALTGTFPLSMSGLSTNGAENTSARVRLTCGTGFVLPTAASDDCVAYAVILPRGAADGGRALQVRYHINVNSSNYVVVRNVSGACEANGIRPISDAIPAQGSLPPGIEFISVGNGKFGGVKFKPAFFYRTSGTATTSATLQLKDMADDPFILLQHNQPGSSNTGSAITEQNRRMFFTWNELAEIFGETPQGNGANWANTTATAAHIDNPKTIGGKSYKLPTSGEYTKLVETPNAGRATVNYYPASFAAVKVDLSADATYSNKGWNHTMGDNNSAPANYIMGYLFFPDESVILASKILVASLNGRWNTTASTLTATELREFTNHGCMFLPAAGNSNGSGWSSRGGSEYYWSGAIHTNTPSQAGRFGITGNQLNFAYIARTYYFATVLVEQ